MSMVLKCTLLGEEAVFGCGVSAAAAEVEQQLEFQVHAEPAFSKQPKFKRTSSIRHQTARTKINAQQSPVDRDRFYSCDETASFDEVFRHAAASTPENNSEESTTVLDESTAFPEEAASVSSEADGPSTPQRNLRGAAVPAEERQVEELRRRLSDVLGPPHVENLGDEDARGTVELLGGYPTCFWRFLRSCNGNIDAAERKLRKTFEFREKIGANSFLQNPDAMKVYDQLKDVWPEAQLGASSDGSPVSYLDLGKAVHFLSLGYDEDTIRSYWVGWMERSNALQRQGRAHASGNISALDMPGTVVLYNLKTLRLSQLTSCLSGLHQFCRVISLAEQHYPSNLRKAVIMNPPSVFSKMVWPLVQKVLDAETLSNVVVCSGSDLEGLTSQELGFSPEELEALLRGRL